MPASPPPEGPPPDPSDPFLPPPEAGADPRPPALEVTAPRAAPAAREAARGVRSRRASLAVAAALVLVAIWEIAWTPHAASSVPADDAWHAAAQAVRVAYRPGDLIVFAPAWADPIGRLHLGDLIPVEMAGRMDAAKYGRIWELSIRDAHSPDVAGLRAVESRDVDGVTVRRFERPAARVLADLRDLAATAKPTGTGAPRVVLQEVGYAPHRCVLVAPTPGVAARLEFPALPAGELVGYVGLADVFTRRTIRSPATLGVEANGQVVASAVAGIDSGWVRFAGTLPTAGPATVVITAQERDRLVCFAAEVRAPGGPR